MTSRSSLLLALALACAPLATGCSHEGREGTTAAAVARTPALPLATLVDPSALGVLHADLASITGSPLWQATRDWVEVLTEGRQSNDAALSRTLLGASELVLYVVERGEGEPRGVVLLRGRYARADAEALRSPTDDDTEHAHGPFTVLTFGFDGAVTILGDHTMVLGSVADVEAVIDRQLAGGNGAYPSGEAYTQLATDVGFDRMPVAFAMVPTERMRRSMSGADDPLSSALAGARGVGFGLDLREGLRGNAVVQLDSTLAAVGIATLARAQLGALAEEPEVVRTGLAPLLRYLTVDRVGSSLVLQLDAPTESALSAFEEFDRFLNARDR